MNLQESKVLSIAEVKAKAVEFDYDCELSEFELDVMIGLYNTLGYDRETVIKMCNEQDGLVVSDDTLSAFNRTIDR
jgi:hypothetical protein